MPNMLISLELLYYNLFFLSEPDFHSKKTQINQINEKNSTTSSNHFMQLKDCFEDSFWLSTFSTHIPKLFFPYQVYSSSILVMLSRADKIWILLCCSELTPFEQYAIYWFLLLDDKKNILIRA